MKQAARISSFAVTSLVIGGFVAPMVWAGTSETPAAVETQAPQDQHVIELAICLDTSGSMDGLINSARQKLWTIVNDLGKAEPTPTLRVALLSFGNDGNNPENGWVKVETPFTEDLDTVSQMLFALTTNGGTELVGRVVETSLQELDWNTSDDALRMVFVAGNESANQDTQVAVRSICEEANALGIDVNSIYCVYGDDDSEVLSGWRELAMYGNGEFATIDQNNGSVVIATPYDQELIKLSADLNETYIPFGAAGAAGCSNQMAQDVNAVQMNTANAASRAATKASKLYSCGSWDLVDAYRNGEVDLASLDDEELPEHMRELSHDQRVAKIKAMQERRSEIQEQINELDKHRQVMLQQELARRADTSIGSFDAAIRGAIRSRAETLGYSFAPIVEPVAKPAVLEPIAADIDEPFEYFVQFSGASMPTTWVSNDLVEEFSAAHKASRNLEHDVHIVPGTPEAEAFIGTLPADVRELVRNVQGAVFLRWNGKVYLLTGGC